MSKGAGSKVRADRPVFQQCGSYDGLHVKRSNDGMGMKTTTMTTDGGGAAAASAADKAPTSGAGRSATPVPTRSSSPAKLSGLQYGVCESPEEVGEAWDFVRARYVAEGILRSGAEADAIGRAEAGPETAVVVGRISGLVVSTVTLTGDERGKLHLPSDRMFPVDMPSVRNAGGKHMVEAGLFADRRSADIDRIFGSALELMRFAVRFVSYLGATDLVCAVPADRARLFGRAFGFRAAGPPRSVRVFGGTEAVLMSASVDQLSQSAITSRIVAYLLDGDPSPQVFSSRCKFIGREALDSP